MKETIAFETMVFVNFVFATTFEFGAFLKPPSPDYHINVHIFSQTEVKHVHIFRQTEVKNVHIFRQTKV